MNVLRLQILFLFCLLSSEVYASLDSLPHWNFYYRNTLILEGHANGDVPVREIKVRRRNPGRILVTLFYDVAVAAKGTLELRSEGKVLKRLLYSGNPAGNSSFPSVRAGTSFVIQLNEILNSNSSALAYPVEFYYRDPDNAEIKLATITFTRSR
jgi:hypothetical protein